MADFYATARSNYVKVKDVEKAKESLRDYGNTIHVHSTYPEYIMIEGGCSGFLTLCCDDDGEDQYLLWRDWCLEHLVAGQTLILIYVGNEKLRYLAAGAEVYTWDGRQLEVDLMNILTRGLRDIGVSLDQVALPRYTTICSWEPPTPHGNFADF